MPGKLKNFLSELAVSPEKLASYQKNPDEAMKAAGLDADECAALKSGDPATVYASLSGQSAAGGQTQSTGAAGPQTGANCIWSPQPQAGANCIWSAQPQANCIWQAQPQANCIWQAQPQAGANCIWAAQPQANCIWQAQPQPQANCIWASQPQANCIWASQPQANCIWQAQPQANCIWSAQPQAPMAAQPYSIFVHHFIHTVPPQANTPTPAPQPSQPSSQPTQGAGTTGTTS